MHRAGPGQLNLSFYRNTMRNMQQQRQYIINLIVSWAFWDIQDERLNNLQSFVEQQWRGGEREGRRAREGRTEGERERTGREHLTAWEHVGGGHFWTLERARRRNTEHENEKPIWVQGGRRSTIWSFPEETYLHPVHQLLHLGSQSDQKPHVDIHRH